MYVLDNVSFIAHPNTGSRSMKTMVQKLGGKCVNDQHGICIPTIEKSRAIVCVVRNPFDMMASWYWRMSVRPKFSHWLENTLEREIGHEDPQRVGGGLFFGLKYATHVIRFERLAAGYEAVFKTLRLPVVELPHKGRARHRREQHYKVLYDDYSKLLIVRKYGDILTALDYKFDDSPA